MPSKRGLASGRASERMRLREAVLGVGFGGRVEVLGCIAIQKAGLAPRYGRTACRGLCKELFAKWPLLPALRGPKKKSEPS